MPKKIIFAIVAMTLVSLTVSQLSCSDKAILDSNRRLIYMIPALMLKGSIMDLLVVLL